MTRLASHGGDFHLQSNSPSRVAVSMPRGFAQQTRHCQWRFANSPHAYHIENNPLQEITSKQPHLGK